MNLIYIVLIAIGCLILLILFGLAVVNKSGEEVLDSFNKTAKHSTSITPLQFAQNISNMFFCGNIKIGFSQNILSDCFSSNGHLTICNKYANEYNLAGLTIVAHELGHAFQFARDKDKMKKHAKRLSLSKILSRFTTPIFLVGIVLLCFEYYIFSIVCGILAIVFFILAVSVKMSTVKIENEASQIALDLLKDIAELDEQQLKIAKNFLDSAKLTYIADVLKIMLKWTGFTRK